MLTHIGTFEKKNAKDGSEYHQLKIALPFAVRGSFLVKKVEQKKNDKSPDFRIYHNGCEVGAIWSMLSKDGQTEYKSGRMLCVLLPEQELRFMVFKSQDEEKKALHPVYFEVKDEPKTAPKTDSTPWD